MKTLLLDVCDQKGPDLLRDLEALQLIQVIDQKRATRRKAVDRFPGKLSTETAERLEQHIHQSRDGWDRV